MGGSGTGRLTGVQHPPGSPSGSRVLALERFCFSQIKNVRPSTAPNPIQTVLASSHRPQTSAGEFMSVAPSKFPVRAPMCQAAEAVLNAVFASRPEIRRKEQNEPLSNQLDRRSRAK